MTFLLDLNDYCPDKFFRDFFSGRTSDRLLIIQCDSGDVNSDLIACAKYCVEDEYTQSRANIKGKAHVVFLIQLPRLAGGCFLGFTVFVLLFFIANVLWGKILFITILLL